jgi:hypothetical protein
MALSKRVHKFTWSLQEQATCTLDSLGNGQIRMSPGGARERWLVTLVNVTCTQLTTINVPTMKMYRSSPVPQYQIGGTFTATLDTDSTDQFLFNMNEDLYFVFTGGDPGAIGSIRIEGTRYVWE